MSTGSNKRSVPINITVSSNWNQKVIKRSLSVFRIKAVLSIRIVEQFFLLRLRARWRCWATLTFQETILWRTQICHQAVQVWGGSWSPWHRQDIRLEVFKIILTAMDSFMHNPLKKRLSKYWKPLSINTVVYIVATLFNSFLFRIPLVNKIQTAQIAQHSDTPFTPNATPQHYQQRQMRGDSSPCSWNSTWEPSRSILGTRYGH